MQPLCLQLLESSKGLPKLGLGRLQGFRSCATWVLSPHSTSGTLLLGLSGLGLPPCSSRAWKENWRASWRRLWSGRGQVEEGEASSSHCTLGWGGVGLPLPQSWFCMICTGINASKLWLWFLSLPDAPSGPVLWASSGQHPHPPGWAPTGQ